MHIKSQSVSQFWLVTILGCIGLASLSLSSTAQPGISRDDMVYTVVEKQPEFPGGLQALREYLRANVNYPDEAQKAGVKGRVFASFVVRRDSMLTDISILAGLGFGCDEEMVRVIRAMPRWTPGSQDGRPLNVKYHLSVPFGVPWPKLKK